MTTPVTALDQRYSDPESVATDWDETRKVPESAQVFFNTGVTQQKAFNLAANPHVVLTTGCNHWDRGLDVVVEGDARRITDDAALARLAERWATRWEGNFRFVAQDGYFRHELARDLPAVVVFSVTPAKVLAFGREAVASHTTHTF